jgi:hypothetical protein
VGVSEVHSEDVSTLVLRAYILPDSSGGTTARIRRNGIHGIAGAAIADRVAGY